ncbi:MAG TPA: TetR/AcrR family transcriptional regulator C-terminal domain-containing protein [Paenirhodobacter sp.]
MISKDKQPGIPAAVPGERPVSAPGSKTGKAQGRAAAIGLTRDQVLKAGVELLDEVGVEGFSIRELSRRLAVYPAAIYWHLGGTKDDLLSELTATITTNILSYEQIADDWRDSIRIFARRYRAAAQQHPHLANLIGAQLRANGPAHAALSEMILRILRRAGLEDEDMTDAMNMLIGGIFGYVTMELAPVAAKRDPDWGARFSEGLDQLDPEVFPETLRILPRLRNKALSLRWTNGAEVPLDGGFARLVEGVILALEAWKRPSALPC